MKELEKEFAIDRLQDLIGALQKTQELLEIILRYPQYDDAGKYLHATIRSIHQISSILIELQ